MIGLDTNVLVRYFLREDSSQNAKARYIVEELLTVQEPGFISLPVMVELMWVLDSTYSLPRATLVQVLELLLRAFEFSIQNEEEVFIAMVALKKGQASFADALIGALNSWAGSTTTMTFDRKAARLDGFTLA